MRLEPAPIRPRHADLAQRRASRVLARITALALGVLAVAAAAQPGSEQFTVERAHTRLVDGVYLLDADIDFHFNDETIEALENGVALTVVVDIEVERTRRHWLDDGIAGLQARYRIAMHPLSGRYLVTNLGSGVAHDYADYDEMQAALGHMRDFPVIDQAAVKRDGHYRLRIRPRVDIESLPSPLRPLAYLHALWAGTDRWTEWPLER